MTGGKRKPCHKKEKLGLSRPDANTKTGPCGLYKA